MVRLSPALSSKLQRTMPLASSSVPSPNDSGATSISALLEIGSGSSMTTSPALLLRLDTVMLNARWCLTRLPKVDFAHKADSRLRSMVQSRTHPHR